MGTETQAITVRLPLGLYERLRREAFDKRVSQASIIIEGLEQRLGRDGRSREHAGWTYPAGFTDELADRLARLAGSMRVSEIDYPAAFLGTVYAVSDVIRDLDRALRDGAPLPKRWETRDDDPRQ